MFSFPFVRLTLATLVCALPVGATIPHSAPVPRQTYNPTEICTTEEILLPHHTMPLRYLVGRWSPLIQHAARRAHIPSRLVAAVFLVENGGDLHGCANRVSSAGAIGPMQLMPTTAWQALHVNPWVPSQNIDGGARFLAQMLRRFHGHLRLALMAYNAGPTLVAQGGRPVQAVYYAQKVELLFNRLDTV